MHVTDDARTAIMTMHTKQEDSLAKFAWNNQRHHFSQNTLACRRMHLNYFLFYFMPRWECCNNNNKKSSLNLCGGCFLQHRFFDVIFKNGSFKILFFWKCLSATNLFYPFSTVEYGCMYFLFCKRHSCGVDWIKKMSLVPNGPADPDLFALFYKALWDVHLHSFILQLWLIAQAYFSCYYFWGNLELLNRCKGYNSVALTLILSTYHASNGSCAQAPAV